jgi:hypothetical protein
LVDKYSIISYNIGTVNKTERKMPQDLFYSRLNLQELMAIYSDLHKEVLGVRPQFNESSELPQGRAEAVRWIEDLAQSL